MILDETSAFVDALGLDEYIVVGESMFGARQALHLAVTDPGTVSFSQPMPSHSILIRS